MTPATSRKLVNSIAAGFIFLFTYTAISKLNDQASFRLMLGQSALIQSQARLVSIGLPVAELVVAVLLFFPHTRFMGLLLSLVLMIVFTGYISLMLLMESELPCSCGGVLQALTWLQHLWLNVFLTILSATGVYLDRRGRRGARYSLT